MKTKLHLTLILATILLSGHIGFQKNYFEKINNSEIILSEIINPEDTVFIQSQIKYKRKYPFISYFQNYPEWQDTLAMSGFFRALSRSQHKKAKVLHIGDSHVQADFFTGTIRDKMQSLFGPGGRGFVFPYASAGTHDTRDYKSYTSGSWRYAKNIHATPEFTLGLSGATIYTEDLNAGFRIHFREGFLHEKDLILKLYCDKNIRAFDACIIIDGDTMKLNCTLDDGLPYTKIVLPSVPRDFQVRFEKNLESSSYFQCYGISIENISGKGILYSSVGINGAGYTSLLRQGLMPEQLREMNPDLIVIDLGANDFYPKIIDQPVFEENLKNVIRIARSVCPGVSVLVTCSQDIYCRKKNVAECKRFAAIARKIAFEMNAAFYDYYQISGGQYAMNKWLQNKLAKPDRVHLTAEGYYIKGELYFNAILNGYLHWLQSDKTEFLISENEFSEIEEKNENKTVADIPKSNSVPAGNILKYTVKSGDNLGSIAAKYNVGLSKLKSWNNLYSDNIQIGQVLKIYTGNSTNYSPKPSVSQGKPTLKPVLPGKTYIVNAGDTLWDIARRNNCTVEQIKSLNNLHSSGIKPGMKIRLP